jgi:uncharacterized protein (DUF302 family)
VEVGLPFEEALMRTRAALAAQGFGVLTEIDVAATLRAEIGPEVPPQIILGACNPPLAHRALQPKPDIGLLLPCNVVVRVDADGVTRISAMDHDVVVALTRQAALRPVATEARDGLASARSRTARRVGEARPAGGGRRGDDESCLTAGRFRASLRIARPAGCAGRRSRNAGDVGRHPCRPAPSILWGTGCRRGERAAVVTEGETGTAIPGTSGGRIVVGVDGSPGGRAALVWALAAGARAGAEV